MNKAKVLRTGIDIFKFLAVGLPSFIIAIPLNILLVEKYGFWKPVSYAIVLVAQTTVNFFLCRRFVFKPSEHKPIRQQYLEFMGAVAVFRGMDWGVYSILVKTTDINYILIQCVNVVIFSIAKFFFSRKAIEGPGRSSSSTKTSENHETL